jgi:thioredoxin-dependent peroxiredoxin
MMRTILRCAVLVATFLCIHGTSVFAELPKVGDQAPDFVMQGSDGKTYASKDYVGKQAVVIAWFPRAFTGGCTIECKSLKEQGDMLKKFDVAYFTASTDPVEKNADFAKSLDLDYPILCDPTGTNAAAFSVLKSNGNAAERVSFIIGKDGNILAVDKENNTKDHGKDLAEQLEKLGVAKK